MSMTSGEYHSLHKIQMTKQYLAVCTPLDACISFNAFKSEEVSETKEALW